MTQSSKAQQQAMMKVQSICELVDAYRAAQQDGRPIEYHLQRLYEQPLVMQVHPDEYMILLCAGGPAVRIVGMLNAYAEPATAQVEYQDWFTPWERLPLNAEQADGVLQFASCVYGG